jgi:tetratricopeptide (TPR) repeat protein
LFAYAFTSRSIEVGLEACDLLRESKAQWNYASALAFVCFGLATAVRFEEANLYVDELMDLSTRLGFGGGVMFAHRVRRLAAIIPGGDPETALRLAYEDLEICRRYDLPWLGQSHVLIAGSKFLTGDLDGAAEEARKGLQLDQPSVLSGWGQATLFRTLSYMGKFEEATEAWREVEPYLPMGRLTNGLGRWSALSYAIDAWYVLGDRQKVTDLYDLAIQATTLEAPVNFDGRTYLCSAGIAAAASGRLDEAEGYFKGALEFADRTEARIEALDIRRFFGAMLLDRDGPGDRERGVALLEEALIGYETLGIPVYASLTKDWLARVG